MPEIQNLKREYDLEERTISRRAGTKAVRRLNLFWSPVESLPLGREIGAER